MLRQALSSMAIICLALFMLPGASSAPIQQVGITPAVFTLSFVSQTHQSLGGGCYNAQVTISASWNGTGTRSIILQNFVAYEKAVGLTITNSTYYLQPSNPFRSVTVFPNLPINLVLYFANFCLVPATIPKSGFSTMMDKYR